jgi:hypothetical protein
MLKRAAKLVPTGVSVCFLADRGFADLQLMRYLRDQLHWNFRIRVAPVALGFIDQLKAGNNLTSITWQPEKCCSYRG